MIRIWPFGSASGSKVYAVYEPAENAGPPIKRAERLVFVADGFSWRAAFFGPLYLAMKRQWVGLAIYIVAAVALVHLLQFAGAESQWITWGLILLNVITGFEASGVQRASLVRAGWLEIGTVSGATVEDAERRFFTAWLPAIADEGSARAGPAAHDPSPETKPLLHRLSSRFIRKSATGI